MNTANDWIEKLNMEPHPEGGFFKETYRSEELEKFDGFIGSRNISTAIYFMITKGNFSAFHRIKSDEMWHFYDGSPIEIVVISSEGNLTAHQLGLDIDNGQLPQAMVPAGCWFASRIADEGDYALAGCTVAPGFDFQDFELADRVDLVKEFPQHEAIIRSLTR
ncbi:MAG: cupin domain-containing protein [Fulvivirga sp.]